MEKIIKKKLLLAANVLQKVTLVEFKIKDEVVYPGHGVAIVEEIIEREDRQLFKLRFKYKMMSILVPEEKFSELGIRFVHAKDSIAEFLTELEKESEAKKSYRDNFAGGWSKRRKEYQLKLKSANLKDVIVTYRDLQRHAEKKVLSFGEKGLLEMAEDLLSQEIIAATHVKKEDALNTIRKPFKTNKKPLQLEG